MKMKLLSFLLAGAMVLGLSACGGATDSKDNQSANAAASSQEKTDANDAGNDKDAPVESSVPKGKIKVGMVTDVGGINDQSFNQTSWEGLQNAKKDLGIDITYLESHTDDDYKTNLESLVDEKCDLIIGVGYKLKDAIEGVAKEYPDQKFAIIDDGEITDMPNVSSAVFDQAEVSYLVGVVAGKMTKTNNCGFVIGASTPQMNQFGYGYVAGIKDTNPKVDVQLFNANSFADPSIGKSAVQNMKNKGADIIFQAAGGTGNGVIEGCKENGIYAIGVDRDQSYIAPETVLTSAMKRVDVACYDLAKAVQDGTYQGGLKVYSLADNGVDISPTQDLLSPDAKKAVEKAKKEILDGKLKVPSTKEEFTSKYGKIYTID